MIRSIVFLASVFGLSITTSQAQINNAKTETIKVYGNCEMCEASIEKAASSKKISKADWNKETKMATITYNSEKTSLDAILKNVALAGYDNESFLAPDEAYNKLPGCCKYERTQKQPVLKSDPVAGTINKTQDHAHHQQDGMNKATADANQLTAVFDGYFALKDAFVKSESDAAAVKAKDLKAAIDAIKMDQLTADVHSAWMQVLNELKKDVADIASNSGNLEKQRQSFTNLSKNVYALVKVSKTSTPVYYQRCPMYNDGKGANWLSRESDIKNPYYGAQMLTCGNTVETIKQ